MRLSRHLRHTLSGIAACLVAVGAALAQPAAEHDLKAAFIYNFIQFTQWPEDHLKGASLNVCATPGTIMYMALQAVAGKTAHGRVIALQALQADRVSTCHVLVAENGDRGRISQIRRVIANEPVLTITDDPELMHEGFMIGMTLDGNRVVFVIDNSRANEAKLAVSSRLLRLAKSVR